MEFKCELSTKQFHQFSIIQYLMEGCSSFGYYAKMRIYWGIKKDHFMFQMWYKNGIIYLKNIIYFHENKKTFQQFEQQFQELVEYLNESV